MHHHLPRSTEPALADGSSSSAAARDWACDYVMSLVALRKDVPLRLLVHRSRCRAGAARARQLAMYLTHVALGRSLAEVALAFGRDRTTVSYACAVIEDSRDDPAVEAEIAELEAIIQTAMEAHHDHH